MKVRMLHRLRRRTFLSPATEQWLEQLVLDIPNDVPVLRKIQRMNNEHVGSVIKAAIRQARGG